MEIRVLRYFLTVVREESITKAADVLHITQPTLSRQLSQMEEDLGVKLFSRGTRKIAHLLEFGGKYYKIGSRRLEVKDTKVTDEEVKQAMAVRVPKDVILSYFYPESSVVRMMEIRRRYESFQLAVVHWCLCVLQYIQYYWEKTFQMNMPVYGLNSIEKTEEKY